MKRRTFIGTSIGAAMMAGHTAWGAEGAHRIERVGLQLYTVRAAMKEDFEGTLAKVAQTGYREVEFAGYFDKAPKDIRGMLDRNGLTSPSEHVPYGTVDKKWPETLEAAQVVGHKYVVCPSIDGAVLKEPDGWKRAAELFNHAGEASKKAGIQFAYHNHAGEFEPSEKLGGKMPYDFLLAETDPKLVKMELDLCWITVAGQDPVGYFRRYPGRFPLVHVKDWKGGKGKMSEQSAKMRDVGGGDIDWKRIFAQSGKAGIKHYFVEHDEPKAPFESTRASYEYLAKLTF